MGRTAGSGTGTGTRRANAVIQSPAAERRFRKSRRAVRKGMGNSVLSAQATVLEIPVTIQGTRPVEGTERRELFIETTKTTLVSENGAVLNLKSRVSLGQCVFLRNDQSGREILCNVLEWRQVGQAGYTDLEFTARDPEFWGVQAEQPAAAGQKPEAQKTIEAAEESPVGTPRMESRAPTTGEMPATFLETPTTALVCPLPLTTETLPEPANGVEWNNAKGAEPLAALFADYAGPKAKLAYDTQKTNETQRKVASDDLPESGETNSDTASEPGVASIQVSRIRRTRKFSAVKNPIAVGIAASALIVVILGVWHAKRGSSIHSSDQPSAASAQSTQYALHSTAQPSQVPASTVATKVHALGNNARATPAQEAQKIQEATVVQEPEPGVAIGQDAPATTAEVGAVRGNNTAADSTAAVAKADASTSMLNSDQAALGQAELQKPNELNTTVTIPAKIVSQSMPSIPPWAKGLDMDAVVQLDALIDEKGNVAQTKPLSGPRVLQGAAERAVTLWIFEPAQSDGKPTATHMVLTVQFQR